MSKARAQELIDFGDTLFTDKRQLDCLCQEIAENVYPERADFISERVLGEEFADHLMDSYPMLARRELGNSISATLRPREKPWFLASTKVDSLDNDPECARFLEHLTSTVKQELYDPRADMISVTKTADHDFVTFGQAPMSMEEGPVERDIDNHLFMRGHHFRDMAWLENSVSVIDHAHRKDAMTARQMIEKFGESKVDQAVRTAREKEPNRKWPMRCVVMPSDEYDRIGPKRDSRKRNLPFVVVYVDVMNQKVVREGGLHDFIYIIPRWHRIHGFQYAFSPAAMTSLPDARMAQDLARIILEAGEKQVDPPLIARAENVQEVNQAAGSISWVDAEYDERLGEALRALKTEGNMDVAFKMRQDVREMLTRSWFLDKLKLPEPGTNRTAYEIARIIEDHVRNLLPLFEPMEVEYNTKLLDKAFYTVLNMKKFDWSMAPQKLKGRNVFWTFKNPMQEASSRILVSQFSEMLQLLEAAMKFGVTASPFNIKTALADAGRGASLPATWRRTQEEIEAEEQQNAARAKIEAVATQLGAAGEIADKVGQGAQQLQAAGLIKGPPQQLALPAPKRAA